MTATGTHAQVVDSTDARRAVLAARIAVVAGIVGAVLGVVQLATPPMVPADQFSAPFTPMLATVAAVVLFLHHLAVIPVILVLAVRCAPSRMSRIGAAIAAVGLVGLAVAELVALTAAHQMGDTPLTDLVDIGYSVPTVLVGLGEVVLGAAVLRVGSLPGRANVLPLVAGLFVFVVLIPALLIGEVASIIALSVWSLLYLALGLAVLRGRARG